jgi:Head domain of trimeric autotransporter adhesin
MTTRRPTPFIRGGIARRLGGGKVGARGSFGALSAATGVASLALGNNSAARTIGSIAIGVNSNDGGVANTAADSCSGNERWANQITN